MAARSRASLLALLYLVCCIARSVRPNPVNIPLNRVPTALWQKAWRALNDHSPTHHLYAHGTLINAQELEEPPYKIYKFTYDLSPICGSESCPKEACTIDLKQDEQGDIETLNDSIQCMYFYPADAQNDMSQEQQSYQEQDDSQVTQESMAEQANNNRSVELDHEIQETGDENIRPFIAMPATSSNYCPGCPYELNPNLPGLLIFGEKTLRSMDEQSAGDYKHKLMSIVRVTRSVPVSSNVIQYQLLLLIGESECLKNALEQEQECPLRSTVPSKLCLVTFEQRPWQQSSLRITKNNCTNPETATSANDHSLRSNLESHSLVTITYDEGQPSRTEVIDAYEGLKDMLDNYTRAPLIPSKEPEGAAVTEASIERVILNKSQDDEKTKSFADKKREFSEFLEDFDLPIKVEDATPDTREAVKEEKFQRKKIPMDNYKVEKANDVVNRRKRSARIGVVGAPKTKPVDDPEIQMYAQKALRQVSEQSDGPNEPLIVEIIEASAQIVAGTLYRIKVKLGTSNCPKGTNDNCQLLIGSEIKECLIKVWSRPWLDQDSLEITVDCSPTAGNRRKRSATRSELIGAPVPKPVDDPEIQMYAQKALRQVSKQSDGPNEPLIVEIIEASVQTVAGTLYKIKVKFGTSNCPKGTNDNCQLLIGSEIKECLIKVWSRPWLDQDSLEITVDCSPTAGNRRKRSATRSGLVGAPEPKPVDDPEIQMYAQKALRQVSEQSDGPNEPLIVEIIEASVQTVAGTLYKIKVKFGTSNCPKGTNDNCQLLIGSEIKECLIKVWSRPWLDQDSLEITVDCSPTAGNRTKRSATRSGLVGAPEPKSVDDPEIQMYAQKALRQVSEQSDGPNEPLIVEIIEASVQTVAGTLYKIKVKFGTSNCPKGTNDNCQLLIGSEIKECLIKVWSRPWLDQDSLEITVDCSPTAGNRRKRSATRSGLVGAPEPKPVDDPEIQMYAQKALRQVSEQSDGPNEPLIVEIIEASVQTVAGTLYKIKVKFGTSNCPKGTNDNCQLLIGSEIKECLIKVWSRPWLDQDSLEITVDCSPTAGNRRKRSATRSGLFGAPEPKPVDDPEIQMYAQKALRQVSEQSDGPNEPLIVEIIEASVQTVAGTLYKIKVKFGTSNCPKGTNDNCQLLIGSEIKECLIKVWSRPWLDQDSLEITVDCSPTAGNRRKRSATRSELVGAPEPKLVDDPEIQMYAQKALRQVSEQSDGPNEPLIVKIIEASVQIVAGTLYRIKAKLGTSDCPKGINDNCQLQAGSEVKECLIKVWSRPWLDQNSLEITVDCSPTAGKRRKRSLRGVNYSDKMKLISEEVSLDTMFTQFVHSYKRSYATDPVEWERRFQIFRKNYNTIKNLRENELGTGRYGINKFADMSREEFQKYLGLRPDLRSENDIPLLNAEVPQDVDLPPSFDWRDKGAVTPVKNQGSCGSCWAFSVTGNIEGQYAVKHGKLLSLSEQELVDCDDLDDGCEGGLPDNAYRAIEKLGGLELEMDYPYEAEDEKCHFKKKLAKVQLASAVNITSDETQMAQWLVKNGPISIGINANAMQFYIGGVSHPFKFLCNPKNLDHGVLIVGYGESRNAFFNKRMPYWIVKNSWGAHWGEQGYYRVYRGDGTCGLNTMATSAVVV